MPITLDRLSGTNVVFVWRQLLARYFLPIPIALIEGGVVQETRNNLKMLQGQLKSIHSDPKAANMAGRSIVNFLPKNKVFPINIYEDIIELVILHPNHPYWGGLSVALRQVSWLPNPQFRLISKLPSNPTVQLQSSALWRNSFKS